MSSSQNCPICIQATSVVRLAREVDAITSLEVVILHAGTVVPAAEVELVAPTVTVSPAAIDLYPDVESGFRKWLESRNFVRRSRLRYSGVVDREFCTGSVIG